MQKPNPPNMDVPANATDRTANFMQAAVEGVVFYTDQAILDCNAAFEQMTGRSHHSLVGSHVMDLFAAKDRDIAARHIYLGRGLPIIAKLPKPDGSSLDAEITGRAWRYGGQACWVATVRDTSHVAYVTDSLVRSQARYRTLVESADQIILFIQDRNVAYANPAAARFYRLAASKLRNTESLLLFHPDDRAAVLARRKALIAGQAHGSAMVRTISPPTAELRPDSVVSWVRFYGALVDWEGRAATLLFMTDLTTQHETEERMQRALAQEKDLGDLKTRFVSMASHEFRTPLATIQTSSELLEHYSDRLSEHDKRGAIADIQRSVQRLQAMMDKFLAFGRMSEGSMRCKPAPLVLLPWVHRVVQETLAADGQQHVVAVLAEPPLGDNTTLLLDEALLYQILGNLLGNACKYSAAGRRVEVGIELLGTPANQLRLVVADQGIGIPPDDLPRLFDSFHRAANAGNRPGNGLGLAIVDRAVRAHGGVVAARSVQGQGAQFDVLLPLQHTLP
jgi:PAS domain S-box-containing protein